MSALYTCIVYTTHTIDTGEYLYRVRETTVFCVYVAQSLFNDLAVYWKHLAFHFHRKLTTQITISKQKQFDNSNKNLFTPSHNAYENSMSRSRKQSDKMALCSSHRHCSYTFTNHKVSHFDCNIPTSYCILSLKSVIDV